MMEKCADDTRRPCLRAEGSSTRESLSRRGNTANQTVRRERPARRRLFTILRPELVFARAKNPWVVALFFFFG